MTVRFHPPENQSAYAERVLALFVQAALPRALEQLEQLRRQEKTEEDIRGA